MFYFILKNNCPRIDGFLKIMNKTKGRKWFYYAYLKECYSNSSVMYQYLQLTFTISCLMLSGNKQDGSAKPEILEVIIHTLH